uniref:Uncharacterized protein n=1 Tax=Leersia perrieri TaxID=77586 RepID=A0A0D9UY97_9ORYZ
MKSKKDGRDISQVEAWALLLSVVAEKKNNKKRRLIDDACVSKGICTKHCVAVHTGMACPAIPPPPPAPPTYGASSSTSHESVRTDLFVYMSLLKLLLQDDLFNINLLFVQAPCNISVNGVENPDDTLARICQSIWQLFWEQFPLDDDMGPF